ncbi:hypothetical protein [Paenibacillus ginsengarvi]|uniref:hypothetical protein n=1 Tax=Paenibacillus ginsengarvi TaxID=400777 RepID=UPI0011C34C1D|nr:hypothetical protein [Paenibacillus ginsengarvi]
MLKFTERIGDIELSYEGSTVEEIVSLKKALNPDFLVAEGPSQEIDMDALRKATQWTGHGSTTLKAYQSPK